MADPYLNDTDFQLYVGDALEVLRDLPDETVDCVVTSPPYWGLRDYGTGEWEGGDENCDHLGAPHRTQAGFNEHYFGKEKTEGWEDKQGELRQPFKAVCGKCGAQRVDQQLGLEPTPDQYVARMVEVFREIRRVLARHGTCWVNLGDSYAGSWGNQGRKEERGTQRPINGPMLQQLDGRYPQHESNTGKTPPGLKPKDLVGIPWRVAFALQADGWYLRSDIIWSKPNPMPESVTDRPTKAHEYIFLLTKQAKYHFDQEAVREPATEGTDLGLLRGRSKDPSGMVAWAAPSIAKRQDEGVDSRNGNPSGRRNIRSVWEIATQPYPEAHFATFPEELARRCILAGAPEFVCTVCNTPVVGGRQQNIPEPQAVQEDVRRVRDTVRGQEPSVLLEAVRDEGTGSQPASKEDVRELRDDVQHDGQAVLLSEVLSGMGDEARDEPQAVAGGQARGELEGREGSRRGLRQGVREGSGLQAGASAGDGAGAGPTAGAVGVRPPQERDQGRQPPGESRTDDEEPASRNGDVPALRRAVRDSLSPCCNAPLRPGRVLDPFIGSGTVAIVARNHARHAIGIELSAEYAELAAKRTRQLSLLAT